MLESNIVEGAQKLTPGVPLVYGKSITDACMGWENTVRYPLAHTLQYIKLIKYLILGRSTKRLGCFCA